MEKAMTYYLTTEELYHHGILGQKWGVRRYQNADGSYTSAGEKRYAKMNKYRDKYVDKARRKKESFQRELDYNKQGLENLKKYGKQSKEYKDYVRKQYDDFEEDYKTTNTKWNSETKEWEEPSEHEQAAAYLGYTLARSLFRNSDQDYRDCVKMYESEISDGKYYIEKYTKRENDLKNMNVTALTSKREIRKKYGSLF